MRVLAYCLLIQAILAVRLPRSLFTHTLAGFLSDKDDNCKDGVCEMPGAEEQGQGGVDSERSVENDLISMGFSRTRARKAAKVYKNDLESAAAMLEGEDDQVETLMKEGGWCEESSRSAVEEARGDIEAAAKLLQTEEESITNQFDTAVKEMVENGWEEVVSRQALLAQWNIDQRKAQGAYTPIDPSDLATIKPTLKAAPTRDAAKQPQRAAKQDADAPAAAEAKSNANGKKGKDATRPKPAKKEDCIFDVTSENFQKVVLESPVPVLLDVYADWCGPCKQLGPMLEKAAIESGGMFRLAKVNSDQQQRIAQNLKVQGLPTVYTVKDGKLTDRFVGMPPQNQLQDYLVRSITGYGASAQKEMTDSDFAKMTLEVAQMAGFASLNVKKKERLLALITEAFWAHGTLVDSDDIKLTNGAKIALTYIKNAANDVRNNKFRTIKTSSTGFAMMEGSEGAIKLIEAAGFRMEQSLDGEDVYKLIHNNVAILKLIPQKVGEMIAENKFGSARSLKKKRAGETGCDTEAETEASSTSVDTSKKGKTSKKSKKSKKSKASATNIRGGAIPKAKSACKLTIRRHGGKQSRQEFKDAAKVTLHAAITQLLELSEDEDVGSLGLELRIPLPRRELTSESSELNQTLLEISKRGEIALGFKKGLSKKWKREGGGVNTLFSTGLNKPADREENEYFGGDSTVFLSAPVDAKDAPASDAEKVEERRTGDSVKYNESKGISSK